MPLIGVFRSLSCLYSRKACEMARTSRLEPLGDVRADHHDAHDGALSAACRPDRDDRLDEVAGRQLADGGELLPGGALAQLRLVHLARCQVAEDRILDVHELLALGAEDGDRAQSEPVLLLDEIRRQRFAPVFGQEPLAIDHAADQLRVTQRRALEVAIVGLRHRERLIERALHLRLEPPLDRLVDKVGRDQEDQGRGDERERQERQHELRLELGADHLLAPLEPELHEISEQQQHEQQEHDQVQVEQREDRDVGGERQLRRVDADVQEVRRAHQQDEPRQDDQVPLAPVLVAQERHYCTRWIVR